MEPRIIAETDTLLVLDKPAGLITHRDGRNIEASVAEWIESVRPEMHAIGEAWVSPQGERVEVNGLVHRLDKQTSGILLAAKTDAMFRFLREEFKARRIEKTYRAFVHGRMDETEGRVVAEIVRTPAPPRRWMARSCSEGDRRAAVTLWRSLGEYTDDSNNMFTELAVQPLTGRTHQIRVHMASIGHALAGDAMYGAPGAPALGFVRPALHAERISLTLTNGTASFSAPLPDDFTRLLGGSTRAA